MSFLDFLDKNGNQAAALSTAEMQEELEKRRLYDNTFPLDVFNPNIRPFVTEIVDKYDIPADYVGLSMLIAYSSAIGTSYMVSRNGKDRMCLSIWGCLNGMTSSGKSYALDICIEPLVKIQQDLDVEWDESVKDVSDNVRSEMSMKTLIYRDAYIPTLIRYIMPVNPKGVLKMSDEILEWINGMNALGKKESTDEQFWLSAWDGRQYSAIRSSNSKYVIPRVFTNVVGGIQPDLIYLLFKNNRDKSGFIFRLLFASPGVHKIARPIPGYCMPQQFYDLHERHIRRLYNNLPVASGYDDPKLCLCSHEAIEMIQEWEYRRIEVINKIADFSERNIHAGILGKMKGYVYRFAALFKVTDIAYNMRDDDPFYVFPESCEISASVMDRALRTADYFYQAAVNICSAVDQKSFAPFTVLQMANMLKANKSIADMAKVILKDARKKSTMHRMLHQAIKDYPKVFGAQNNI